MHTNNRFTKIINFKDISSNQSSNYSVTWKHFFDTTNFLISEGRIAQPDKSPKL